MAGRTVEGQVSFPSCPEDVWPVHCRENSANLVEVISSFADGPDAQAWIDQQGLATLVAGSLLILISTFTNFSHDDLLRFATLGIDEQIGVSLHLAALAALAGDVQLATRVRHRAAIDRKREANEIDRERDRAARRARIQARCTVAQFRFLLADTARNRLLLSATLAELQEEFRRQ